LLHPGASIPRLRNARIEWMNGRIDEITSLVTANASRPPGFDRLRGKPEAVGYLQHLLGAHRRRVVTDPEPVVLQIRIDLLDTRKP
jgi:hypothetical protein